MEQFLNTIISWGVQAAIKLILALLVLVIGLKLAKFITQKIKNSKGMQKADPSVRSFLSNCVLTVLDATVIVSAAIIVGVPAASFIALLGTAGVAVGLALQGAFSNFAGGIMILLFHPFKVGHYIDNGGLSGTVIDISIFYTTLKTPDNKHITIPNGSLMNSSVINYSSESTRRLDLKFSVAYGTDVEKVNAILLKKANEHPCTLKDPAPFARLSAHNESSLDFVLRIWCNSADYWTLNFDLLESIKKEFEENNIEIPFPQLDVHVKNN